MENSENLSTVTTTYIGWLEFSLRIIEAIAWPALILFLAVRYGKHIIYLLPNIETLKLPGIEAAFREVRSAQEAAKSLEPVSQDTENNDDKSYIKILLEKSDIDPIGTAIEINNLVDGKLEQLQRSALDEKFDEKRQTISEILSNAPHKIYQVDLLSQAGWLSEAEAKIVYTLKSIRMETLKLGKGPVTSSLARDAVRLAETLINSISLKIKEINARNVA